MYRTRFFVAFALAVLATPAVAFAQSSDAGDAAAAAGAGITFALFGVVMLAFYVFVPIVFIAFAAFWVFALIDVATRNEWEFPNALQGRPSSNDKVMWLLVVLLASYIGAAVYYFVVMRPFPLKTIRAARPTTGSPAYAPPTAPVAPDPSAPSSAAEGDDPGNP